CIYRLFSVLFFSSRRRHTRFKCDWSSDVCSSDLEPLSGQIVFGEPDDLVLLGARSLQGLNLKVDLAGKRLAAGGPMLAALSQARSEERRVGEGCRGRAWREGENERGEREEMCAGS